MFHFATRPLGYLTVGGLAMVLGLATGIGIGYFFGGDKPAQEIATIAGPPAEKDTVISLAASDDSIKALPVPILPARPLARLETEDDSWTEIPDEVQAVATDAPAPWPELAEKISNEKLAREATKREAEIKEAALKEAAEDDIYGPGDQASAEAGIGSEDLWAMTLPGSEEESLTEGPGYRNKSASDIVAALPPSGEKAGDRIDREARAWEKNSVSVADPAGKPMISIVIDDLGLNRRNTVRTIRLPGPLTLAFLTYAEDLERQTSSAHAAGHELMVHFPMEPKNPDTDTGPNALRRDMSEKEIRRRFNWGMDRFPGYVGINNHMGSAFTGDAKGMAVVMDEVRKRDILYLDSMTTQRSVGRRTAARAGVPFVARDVFLDNEIDARQIDARLAEVEQVARRQGHAIAIGHPHKATIEALARWLPHLEEAGFVLVPISMIVKHRRGA